MKPFPPAIALIFSLHCVSLEAQSASLEGPTVPLGAQTIDHFSVANADWSAALGSPLPPPEIPWTSPLSPHCSTSLPSDSLWQDYFIGFRKCVCGPHGHVSIRQAKSRPSTLVALCDWLEELVTGPFRLVSYCAPNRWQKSCDSLHASQPAPAIHFVP